MTTITKPGFAWVVALGILVSVSVPAQAQFYPGQYYNPYAAAQAQYNYNLMRAQAWAAYNAALYRQAQLGPTATPTDPRVMSPVLDPYAGAASTSYYANPATITQPIDPYSSNPYSYSDPWGGYLRGYADVLRAHGQVVTSYEQARLMREQALQAKLDTRKKAFELELFIRNNTPTFTQEQEKIAKQILRRVQNLTNPNEIWNGSSLNILLADMKKHQAKKVSVEPIQLAGEVLRHINVTGSFGNLGLLRDDGRFQWPSALQDLVAEDRQKKVGDWAETLVARARNGQVEVKILKDVRLEIETIRENLLKKVNEIPTQPYIDAKRFLKDFEDACTAVEKGDAVPYFEFQKFVANGRSVKEVIDYMIGRGLTFAKATQGDESAYLAFQSGLVATNIEVNTQLASAGTKE